MALAVAVVHTAASTAHQVTTVEATAEACMEVVHLAEEGMFTVFSD